MDENNVLDDPRIARIARAPRDIDIDFTTLPAIRILAHDIVRCNLRGQITSDHDFNRANFVQCLLSSVNAHEASFAGSDFKDSSIRDATFKDCNFRGAHLNTSTVADSSFEECQFTLSNFNRTNFVSCLFRGVDFSDLLIKGCRFTTCEFVNCKTSNKLFESCLLFDSQFREMELQLQTVTDNVGLLRADTDHVVIRSGSPREGYSLLNSGQLETYLSNSDFTNVEKFKIAYYLFGLKERSYKLLDPAFDVADWLRICKVPAAFSGLIESIAEFFLYLLAEDRLIFHPILKFHALTSLLSEQLRAGESLESQDVYRALMGVHMSISRSIEEYLLTLTSLAEAMPMRTVAFAAEGPVSRQYFENQLRFLWDLGGLQLVDVKPRNSPVELLVRAADAKYLLIILGVFLASRTQLEIRRLRRRTPVRCLAGSTKQTDTPAKIEKEHELFSIYAGRARDERAHLELRVKSILPGSLLLDLHLNVHIPLVFKLRSILLELLSSPGRSA